MTEQRIEIIHDRDPDAECELTVYLDGEPVDAEVYEIDPGRGYLRSDWDETTAADCAEASPNVAVTLRQRRDEVAEHSAYIE